jgi:hypothetical protein
MGVPGRLDALLAKSLTECNAMYILKKLLEIPKVQ